VKLLKIILDFVFPGWYGGSMTKRQYKKLVDNVTHMEIDNNLFGVSKRITGDGPVLIAQLLEEGEVTEVEFTEAELLSGKIDRDGEVYIAEMEDSSDCAFYPLTLAKIF
jgi:hypothetical protein